MASERTLPVTTATTLRAAPTDLASLLRHPTADDVGKMLLVALAGKVRIVKMTSFEGLCVSDTSDDERWIWEAFEAGYCFVLPDVPGLNAPAPSPIHDEIEAERERQAEKWGGDDHDDFHEPAMWIALIAKHSGRAMNGDFREQMIRVAALAVAAVEVCDRHRAKARAIAAEEAP